MKKLLPKTEFSRHTFTLIIGTVIAQTIPLFLHPFLRRIYTPEDFGAMSIYLSIFGIIAIVSSLRYEVTIILPKNNVLAINILFLTFLINIIISILILLGLILFKNEITLFMNLSPKYSNNLYYLPFATLFFGMYQSINYWLIRQKAFKASTTNKIIRRSIEGAIQFILGLLKIPSGLIIGDIAGNSVNLIAGLKQSVKHNLQIKFISQKKIFYAFKKYIEYPKFNMFPTLMSSVASVLPFFFINKFYSTEMVGYIDLTKLVLSIPLIFISATISQVFFQHAAEKKNNNLSIQSEALNIVGILLSIIAIESIVIMFVGPLLFKIIFGEQYLISGVFSQILIFGFAANFISSTFSSTFMIFEKIRTNSIWQVTYFCIICSLGFMKSLSINVFLKTYVCIEITMHLINCFMIFNIIRKYEYSLKKN